MVKMIARVSVLVGAIGLALAGCGSSGKTSTSSSSGSAAASSAAATPVSLPGTVNQPKTGDATSGTLAVELDDFYFGPSFIKVTPGSNVTLQLKNEGKSTHTFTSTSLAVDKTLKPGEATSVEVTLPAAGATAFHCRFHEGQGMQGAFFTKDGDTVNAAGSGAGSSGATTTSSADGYYN
jgi:plastocyanin